MISAGSILVVELTSADPELALEQISKAGIEIRNVFQKNELTYCFQISRKFCKQLETICQKRGYDIRYTKRAGLYWRIRHAKERPVLLVGSVALLFFVLWIPTRVFFVSVEGNTVLPERKILEVAEKCGISFGASRRAVRSEQIKNELLSALPELKWAGVNTAGCTASISVREKEVSDQSESSGNPVSIVACRDGYVLSCTVTGGNPQVAPGTLVREGQVLVSAYTDCGRSIRIEQAEGEILAQTRRNLAAVFPAQCIRKTEGKEIKRKISLLIGKKRINLWKDSGISDTSCDRMYEEYYITLPGGFRLPVALCVDEFLCFGQISDILSDQEAEAELRHFAKRYLEHQMVAGKIINAAETVISEAGLYRLQGSYDCIEMIGKVRQEQIGDTNGENS